MRRRQEHPIRFFALTSRLREAADVTALLRVLMTYGDGLTPSNYDDCGPPKSRFDPLRPEDAAKHFAEGVMLSLYAPAAKISLFNHIEGYRFGSMSICLARDAVEPSELTRLVCEISALLKPEIGFVHLLNDHDRDADRYRGMRVEAADEPSFGIFHKALGLGLPEFYWGMVFGEPYVTLLGDQQLRKVPAYRIESTAEAVVYVQLTEDIADCWDNPARLSQARQVAKSHLGMAAFMNEKLRRDDLGNFQLPWHARLFSSKPVVPPLSP